MKKLFKLFRLIILKSAYIRWMISFIRSYNKSLSTGSLKTDFWAFRQGFHVDTVKLYGINKSNYPFFLSDKIYEQIHPVNGVYNTIIDNKLYLPFLLKDYRQFVPDYYFLVERGRAIYIGHPFEKTITVQSQLDLCKKLVVKPCSAEHGFGFSLVEKGDNGAIIVNNRLMSPSEFDKYISKLHNFIITEYVDQHPYSHKIYPYSSNTIRLLCLWDYSRNEHFFVNAYHRFGTDGRLVDNVSDGNLAAFIDLNSGRISNKGFGGKFVNSFMLICDHPNTQEGIAGVKIPDWNNMLNTILGIMDGISFIKFAGIDVIVTEAGFKIIELNSFPKIRQSEAGLMTDVRFKHFIAKHLNTRNQ